MKKHSRFFAILVLFVAPLSVHAQSVITSTYNGTTPGTLFVDSVRSGISPTFTGVTLGQSFATGAQSYTFTSIMANMQLVVGASSDLVAGIYSSSSGAPGTLLASLTVPTMTLLTQANHTFTTGATLTFSANTTYWFVVGPTLLSTNLVDARWYQGTSELAERGQALGFGVKRGELPKPMWHPPIYSPSLPAEILLTTTALA